jgi:hypothetical protein
MGSPSFRSKSKVLSIPSLVENNHKNYLQKVYHKVCSTKKCSYLAACGDTNFPFRNSSILTNESYQHWRTRNHCTRTCKPCTSNWCFFNQSTNSGIPYCRSSKYSYFLILLLTDGEYCKADSKKDPSISTVCPVFKLTLTRSMGNSLGFGLPPPRLIYICQVSWRERSALLFC